jgi:hypothetical protein
LGQVLSRYVSNAIDAIAADSSSEARELFSNLLADPALITWHPRLRHAQAQQARLQRDQRFKDPTALAVRAASTVARL